MGPRASQDMNEIRDTNNFICHVEENFLLEVKASHVESKTTMKKMLD
jgi:hypothetical protein